MTGEYVVSLRITVNKGKPEALVVMEESIFAELSFSEMTRISSEFYELAAKLQKARK